MSPSDLKFYRQLLLDLRDRVTGEVNHLIEAAPDNLLAAQQAANMPLQQADQVTEGFDKETAIIQNEQAIRAAIVAALQRIDNATYGNCVRCGTKIAPERLKAIPFAEHCAKCASLITTT